MPYLGLIIMILWVFCLIDVVTADEGGIRYLPKTMWLLFVVFVPLAGSIVWLVAGRPIGGGIWGGAGVPSRSNSAYPEYDTRPGRAVGTSPEADEEFLRQCRARAEEQRRRARGE
ncbi:PLDc N-terminal domain-containing protein [Rhodococcoides kyotonense]|uniref:Phospholipase_D-nuclease N-terminal n=1 Tax=Rhodococcoides kyotonense TaxID=398843 RepID=A0A239L4R2_9NOCA|nr:PLD nuclease N-terminal domain-containing protein [Rhodococcus kyotonensis]SNT25315.1 Phospholipase_D-nuclease N-terminal [Rhodococcus kyotonensis]